MKFDTLRSFDRDYRRLAAEHQALFRKVVADVFVPACDAYAADPAHRWPSSLRVKPVRSAPGILEMTWSFAGPDGRATFEIVTAGGELHVRWRRIGDHAIFDRP